MRLELQRLLAKGGLPNRVVVDVSALLRRHIETGAQANVWGPLLQAASRSRRDILWVVAPTADGTVVTGSDLDAAVSTLRAAGIAPVRSTVPVAALITGVAATGERVGIVSAGLEERPYELWPLGVVTAMLDAETGVLWSVPDAEERYGPPRLLPELAAITGIDGVRGLAGNAAPRYVPGILSALAGSVPWHDAEVHPSVKKLVGERVEEIAARALTLRGQNRPADASAHAAVAAWLCAGPVLTTAYFVAQLTRSREGYHLQEVHVLMGTRRLSAAGEVDCTALLRQLVVAVPGRWFAPRALDLLAAMVDRGLDLPACIVDPAIIAFVLNTSSPSTMEELAPSLALSAPASRWFGDIKRKVAAPVDLEGALDVLPALDTALAGLVSATSMTELVESDLAPTLPVLARVERMGAWVGQPVGFQDWGALTADVQRELAQHERDGHMFAAAKVNVHTADYLELASVLKFFVKAYIPRERWSPDLSFEQEFKRFVELGVKEAVAAKEARSLTSPSGVSFWLRELSRAPSQLRGMSVPQRRGRFGMRDLPLQNLPKRSKFGKAIRSGLTAPPGHTLVGADQNGYEVRLLADLSGDADLVAAAQHADVHIAVALRLFGSGTKRDRALAKLGMYSVIYGQDEDQFRRSRHELTNAEAVDLYRKVHAAFPGLFAYRSQLLNTWKAKNGARARTRGGWPLDVDPKIPEAGQRRSRFNGHVQGLAADIQRWVLRELDVALRPHRARIVHQAHDEIFVAVPDDGDVAGVETILVDRMTTAVMTRSGLLAVPVTLVAEPKRGATWLDMM